jgi:hypothetical protein
MKTKEEEKKTIPWKTVIAVFSGLAGIAVIYGLAKNNMKLRGRVNNLQGQIDNQNLLIAGLKRDIERTSFINGKLTKK